MSLGLLTAACAFLKPARTPMPTVPFLSTAPAPKHLIVFLPGRASGPSDYEEFGFVKAVRDRHLDVDMVAADAHLGYYYRWTFITRFHEDVILPARTAGYDKIWLVGISAGGIGAVNYARYHPEMVSGIYIMAPYLGDTGMIQNVRKAGGLEAWQPPADIPERDYQNATWAWLKAYHTNPGSRPPLAIGIGSTDRFAPANQLVADVLPPDRVFRADGGHVWRTWQRLWNDFLDTQTWWPRTSGR